MVQLDTFIYSWEQIEHHPELNQLNILAIRKQVHLCINVVLSIGALSGAVYIWKSFDSPFLAVLSFAILLAVIAPSCSSCLHKWDKIENFLRQNRNSIIKEIKNIGLENILKTIPKRVIKVLIKHKIIEFSAP